MDVIPVRFIMERNKYLPIMTVIGVAEQVPEIDKTLLAKTVGIIEKAGKYEGRQMELTDYDKIRNIPKGVIAVKFQIIFENNDKLQEWFSGLEKELG